VLVVVVRRLRPVPEVVSVQLGELLGRDAFPIVVALGALVALDRLIHAVEALVAATQRTPHARIVRTQRGCLAVVVQSVKEPEHINNINVSRLLSQYTLAPWSSLHPFIHPSPLFTHFFILAFIHSFIHPSSLPLIHTFIHSLFHPFVRSYIHPSIRPFKHS
jgi:hypothetical protein